MLLYQVLIIVLFLSLVLQVSRIIWSYQVVKIRVISALVSGGLEWTGVLWWRYAADVL